MRAYSREITKRTQTPVTEPILGRETEMVNNTGGGYGFKITPMSQALRFLILGTEGGTYYVSEAKLTVENTRALTALLNGPQGPEVVDMIRDVSINNRAAKLSPTLYALALAYASENVEVRRKAAGILNDVVRTHSHLLEFISYVDGLRGWGRLLRESVAGWYNARTSYDLAYQLAKYRNRSGWMTRDALRMAKPRPKSPQHAAIFGWATGRSILEPDHKDVNWYKDRANAPSLLAAVEEATMIQKLNSRADTNLAVKLINENGLTREMIPNTWLNSPDVWEALLENMPMTAMIRNLGKMTEVGLLTPLSNAVHKVAVRLNDGELLQRARIHPFNVLLALSTYKAGWGVKSSLHWDPTQEIMRSLETAFYNSFAFVKPTGLRYMLSLDVSGSMYWNFIAGCHLMAGEAAATMAMVTARSEERYVINGFDHELRQLNIDENMSLNAVISLMRSMSFGETNCSAPFKYAEAHRIPVDVFVVYTDNATNVGRVHPSQALKAYRENTGINARMVVVSMTATQCSIADPTDSGMLDIVGFDSSTPKLLNEFAEGALDG